jgi:hypothetical protein
MLNRRPPPRICQPTGAVTRPSWSGRRSRRGVPGGKCAVPYLPPQGGAGQARSRRPSRCWSSCAGSRAGRVQEVSFVKDEDGGWLRSSASAARACSAWAARAAVCIAGLPPVAASIANHSPRVPGPGGSIGMAAGRPRLGNGGHLGGQMGACGCCFQLATASHRQCFASSNAVRLSSEPSSYHS